MRFKRVTTSLIARKEALREYRKRNVVFWVLLLGWLPVVILIAVPLGQQLKSNWLTGTVMAGWLIATFVAGIWRLSWRCPRCNKKFYSKWWYNHAFAMRCVNCGYKPGQ